ncbi:MAG: cobalamin-binding protein [Candidatus Competibacteraceae bacterium]|jgi:iron complex transport system substrate-binding protein|nr:cobalamin-binding protein [Candidatus Competibacteraceae bacterium]
MNAYFPQRIVCMTEETTEALYLLGEQDRIVGISGYTVRPPQARREKPRISAFTHANIKKILALSPDLALGFSDLQADIAAQLIREGIAVHLFNQRSVQGILDMILVLGSMVGAYARTQALLQDLTKRLESVRHNRPTLGRRPRVYFEEWDKPRISGIRWVSELIEIAGGEECFPERAVQPLARDRIIAEDSEIIDRQPDIIIGSWCGKKFRPDHVRERPGWEAIPAVHTGQLHEIKSALILQPGPAALTDGLTALQTIIQHWYAEQQVSA